jgi:hypothetical protein
LTYELANRQILPVRVTIGLVWADKESYAASRRRFLRPCHGLVIAPWRVDQGGFCYASPVLFASGICRVAFDARRVDGMHDLPKL